MRFTRKCFFKFINIMLAIFFIWCHQICYAGCSFEVNRRCLYITVTPGVMERSALNAAINELELPRDDDGRIRLVGINIIQGVPHRDLALALVYNGVLARSLCVSNLDIDTLRLAPDRLLNLGYMSSMANVLFSRAIAVSGEGTQNRPVAIVMELASVLGVEYLNLTNNALDANDVSVIVSNLQGSSSFRINSLMLSGNRIGADGARILADALRGMLGTQLEYLDIRENEIGIEGHRSFAEALSNGSQLRRINLANTAADIIPVDM